MQHSLEKNTRSAMVRVKRVNRKTEEKRNACQDDEQAEYVMTEFPNDKTPYRDLYNIRAEIHFSPEHDESFNIGPYHPPSPDLFSPSTSTSSFSETHFSPASPTGYSMKLYQPPFPDLYSPSPLFMGEFVDPDIQPEDKKVVVEDEVTTSYSPCPETPPQTLDPMPAP
ncbi:hypothetical protein ATANTOWER_020459 [Ataeniobius toweri]|uniref:Uncharacterized protein n=1 Tax=Ataeniobius toweri TaxID=208326 RepID=A0ABU7B824_9TELE|nr:hypothetical protein [Ataeniobius toweri]